VTSPVSSHQAFFVRCFHLSLYQFCLKPDNGLAWLGRMSQSKVEDAWALPVNIPLYYGQNAQDEDYCVPLSNFTLMHLIWILRILLSTTDMQQQLRQCQALLMTPRCRSFWQWHRSFLSFRRSVIAYRSAGEIVHVGRRALWTGDSVEALIARSHI